jgi:nicotinate dehydrogenase subunit A
MSVRIVVNGVERESEAAEDTPLLYALRNDFDLKATRFGCGTEQCGSCTVLLDGRPVMSCTLPLSAARGRQVTTLEGLGTESNPHPLQRALIDEQAGQCGYCLSGIVMRAAALLAQDREVDEASVRAALDGHLCRCGAHNRIVRAVLRAAAKA